MLRSRQTFNPLLKLNTKNKSFPWKPIGPKPWIVFDPTPVRMITLTKRIAHFKILAVNGEYTVRTIGFESKVRGPVVETEESWTTDELRLAFAIGSNINQNDVSFANSHDAEFGIRKKFVRNDDRLVVFCKDFRGKEYEICFLLNNDIKQKIDQFLKFA